ncbi:MAG: ImcF-related family protein [Nannocystaceae bacterium]
MKSQIPGVNELRGLAASLELGADVGPLLVLAAVVVVALLVLVLLVLGALALVRRRRARALGVRVERAWRRRCARDLHELCVGPRSAARTWLIVGDAERDAARLLEGLDARPLPAHPEQPRWWRAKQLRLVALPEELAPARRTWLFKHLRRSGDRDLALHGVLLPVDASRLLTGEHAALAAVREHAALVADIAAERRLELPLVAVLTGLDRLPAADEALRWIAGEEAQVIAGPAGIERALEEALDALRDALVTGVLAHAATFGDPIASAGLLRTRQHLADLEGPLRALVRRLEPADAARLRGCARPRALQLGDRPAAARADGRHESAPARGTSALAGLLSGLSKEARPIRRARVGRRVRGALLASAALAASVALGREVVHEQRADRSALEETTATLEAAVARPSALRLEQLDALSARWRRDASPRIDGGALADALDRYVDAALLRGVLDPSAAARELEIDALTRADLDRAAYVRLRDALEAYLRLTAENAGDPCGEQLGDGAAPPELVADEPAALLDLMRRRPWPLAAPPPRDPTRVAAARRALGDVDADQLLEWIADDLARGGLAPAIEVSQLGRALAPRDLAVPGIYSRDAWPRVHAAIAAHGERARCWAEDPPALTRSLRSTYARRYREAWERFADALRVRRPRSLEDAHDLLDRLVDPTDAPLDAALRSLAANTLRLASPRGPIEGLRVGVASATAGDPSAVTDARADAEAIAAAMRPLAAFAGLDAYHEHLAALRRELDAAADDPAAIDGVREAATAAIADTREAILSATADRRARERLRALLLPPLEALVEHVASNTGDHLRDAFCGHIAGPMRALLDGRYPWAPRAHEEIPLRDLDALLHPRDGAVVRFLREELEPWIVVEGARLTPRPRGRGDRQRLDPAVLRFFAAALAASDALYVDDELRVDMTLTLRCTPGIHRVGLSVDDQDLHYTCADSGERPIQWPGEGEPSGAWLEVHGRGGAIERHARPGAWGLWRLLEERASLRPDGDAIEARLHLLDEGLGELPLRLRPSPSHRALFRPEALLEPLRDPALRPPAHLFAGQERCGDVR